MDRSKGLTHLPKSVRPPFLKEETLVNLVNQTYNDRNTIINNLSKNKISNACPKIAEILANYID